MDAPLQKVRSRPRYSPKIEILKRELGQDVYHTLVEQFSGQRLWIATTPTDAFRTLLGVGLAPCAERLCKLFGGDYLSVPQTPFENTSPKEIARKVAELHRQGSSINSIAATISRNCRTVFRYLNRPITELH
jgi:hypothetical protein